MRDCTSEALTEHARRTQSVKRPPKQEAPTDLQALQQNFGENLKKARGAVDPPMTQSVLAKQTGMDRTHISNIESGKVNITIETASQLAAAVSMTALELFSPTDEFDRILRRRKRGR